MRLRTVLVGLFAAAVVRFVVTVIGPRGGAATPKAPRISGIRPRSGWPGSIVEIEGANFDPTLDGNLVEIGGDAALVLRAAPNALRVLVGEKAGFGPIRVTTAGMTATAAEPFGILPSPDPRDSGSAGPPIFFHGPQNGTPAVGKKGQRVVAIFASAAFEPAVDIAAELAAEMVTFQQAERFWREATYETGAASHGTSFKIEQGPAVTLPRRRNEYVWDQADVDWARGQYINLTKRWTHIAGSRALCAHQGGGLAVADLAAPNAPVEVGRLAPGWIALHVVVRGNTAFIAAGTDGLIVADIAGATPVQLAKVTLGGNLRALDISGNTLVAAALHGGLEVYDVSNPFGPIRRAVIDAGADWASAVRLTGTRAIVGAGERLRIYDVANASAPVRLGEASVGDWAMGLDVAGNTCAVATDGNGLAIFDISGPVPMPRGSNKEALRIHGVRFAGTTAYVACGGAGMMILDVSNPAAPVKRSLTPTGSACYDVAVAGGVAVVALGASGVAPADLSDPVHPLLGLKNYLTSTPPLGGDYSLDTLQTNLKNADDSHGKLKDNSLFVDGLLAAKAAQPSLDLNSFEGFIIVLRGLPGRGASGLFNSYTARGQTVSFTEKKGMIWLASHTGPGVRTTWGRKAHELGHWLGMDDIYEERFEDGTVIEGSAAPWDMAGDHDRGPLFSGREAVRMQMFDGANHVRRDWNPAGGPTNETFDIAAHGATEDTGARIHLLQLQVAPALSYFVEVRQPPGTVIFDANLPLTGMPPPPGVVLVTRATEDKSLSNTFEQAVQVFGVLTAGQSVVDAARLLRIEAQAVTNLSPLTYRVIVHWNEEPPENPAGLFDLRITPWNTENWETPDIWINSPRNDGATMIFSSHEPGDETRPILNGDKPWVKHANTMFARITNSGVQAASNVIVTAYTTSPPGIGDNGSWATLRTITIPSIPAGGNAIAQFTWKPAADKHTCVSAAIFPQPGEIQPKNNRTNENVFEFDSAGSSSHEPVILEAEVRSPFTVWRRVDLIVQGLPDGWHAVIDKAWVWLDAKASEPVTAVIWTDLDSPRAIRGRRIVDEALARVEGWTDFYTHRYLPIGGILSKVRANKRTLIRFEAIELPGAIRVIAVLDPAAPGVRGVVEITDAAGVAQLTPFVTNAQGGLDVTTNVAPGKYTVQVFSASTRGTAEAESIVREVQVPA